MNNKNLLLGFGETLTHPIKRPPINPNKAHPYSLEEARQHLLNSSIELLKYNATKKLDKNLKGYLPKW